MCSRLSEPLREPKEPRAEANFTGMSPSRKFGRKVYRMAPLTDLLAAGVFVAYLLGSATGTQISTGKRNLFRDELRRDLSHSKLKFVQKFINGMCSRKHVTRALNSISRV